MEKYATLRKQIDRERFYDEPQHKDAVWSAIYLLVNRIEELEDRLKDKEKKHE